MANKVKSNGNGAKQLPEIIDEKAAEYAVIDDSTTDKAFKQQDTLNALNVLVKLEEEYILNATRLDIPNSAFSIAAADYITKCIAHGYEEGANRLMLQMGLMTSIKGKRIEITKQAIIGDRQFRENTSGKGLIDKIKGWYNKNE